MRRSAPHARVTFCGELDAKALDAKFNAASVFALATRYEGYGMVLSEAMLHGLPVVTCAVGAVPATVGDAALLVPGDAPPAFAAELRRLLTDEAHANSARERSGQRARGLTDWKDTARVFIKVIGDLATYRKEVGTVHSRIGQFVRRSSVVSPIPTFAWLQVQLRDLGALHHFGVIALLIANGGISLL